MLLRSSSAPILGCCISQADLVKDNEHDGPSQMHHKIPAHPAPFSCWSPACVCRASHEFQLSSCAHESRSGSGDLEKDPFSLPRMKKAQSESDLASLSGGVANRSAASSLMSAAADVSEVATQNCSSLHRQWTRRVSSCGRGLSLDRNDAIWEECELSESESEEDAETVTLAETSVANSDATKNFIGLQEQHLTAHADRVFHSPPVSASGTHFRSEDGEFCTSVATSATGQLLLCNSKGCRPMTESEKLSPMLMASGVGLGMGGGSGGRDGSRGQNDGFGGDSNSTEEHYQNLLQADPQNPLFLRNYAQYLSETKHQYKKAEEYYERAILACPNDGDVLSKYAKHVWDVHNDHDRAELYYDQAMKAAPEDSYVLASYASFLWDSEDEEGDTAPHSGRPILHSVSTRTPSVAASA